MKGDGRRFRGAAASAVAGPERLAADLGHVFVAGNLERALQILRSQIGLAAVLTEARRRVAYASPGERRRRKSRAARRRAARAVARRGIVAES